MDGLIVTSKYNIQYLLGVYRFLVDTELVGKTHLRGRVLPSTFTGSFHRKPGRL